MPVIDETLDLREALPEIFLKSGFLTAPSYDAARVSLAVDILQQNGAPCRLWRRTLELNEASDVVEWARTTSMEIYMIEHQGQLFSPLLHGSWEAEFEHLGRTIAHLTPSFWIDEATETDCRDPSIAARVLIHWEREGVLFDRLVARAVSHARGCALDALTSSIAGQSHKPRPRI